MRQCHRIPGLYGFKMPIYNITLKLIVFLTVLSAFGASLWAQSEPDFRPGIVGKDDRRIIDSWDHPWGAIGHINVSGYRMRSQCTGTLIAPKIVLTAAHCLMDHWKRKPYPPHNIHFVPGVRRDKSLGHSKANCVRLPKSYQYVGPEKVLPSLPTQTVPFESFNLDVGIVVLADAMPMDPIPLASDFKFSEGLALVHPAYAADRRFMLSADFTCNLISTRNGVWGTSCDTHPGSSGGPVLIKRNDEYLLAAVLVGSSQRLMTFAVPISAWEDMSLSENCP